MIIYIIVNEDTMGERNILGVFDEYENAFLKASEYSADNPEEECWIEEFEMNEWLYETEAEYKIVHRTMVSKKMAIQSHVVKLMKEEVKTFEESEEWYIIQQVNETFDREQGFERNLRFLKEYIEGKKED